MNHTHDLSEWAAFLLLGVGGHAVFSVAYFLLVDADRADFDPRPAARRCIRSVRVALEAGPLTPFWEAVIIAGHLLNRILATALRHARPTREACRDAAALLILLLTSPKGQLA